MITGANSGIGKATAKGLAKLGTTVILICRNKNRGEAAMSEIKSKSGNESVDLMLADLSSQESICQLAKDFKKKYQQLHVLINNAANFDLSLRKPTLTKDGVEVIFATNHLGPFLLTNLLLDVLKASAPARILNITSKGLVSYPRLTIEFDDLNGEKKRRFSPSHAYYHSKLAQVMFTYELAERLKGTGVAVNCIRVTNVKVDEGRYDYLPKYMRYMYKIKRLFAITPEEMAKTYIYLATSPEVEDVSGKCFDENQKEVKSSKRSYDESVCQRLWQVSAELTKLDLQENKFITQIQVVLKER